MKVDFGVHVKGRIVDSAFTLNFEPTYDSLLEAVKDATNAGIRVTTFTCHSRSCLIRVCLWHRKQGSMSDCARLEMPCKRSWSHTKSRSEERRIQVSRSIRSVPIFGTNIHIQFAVKAISNLNGHSIAPYSIHGGQNGIPGKSVPIVKMHGSQRDETKMEEGEYYAIETFGSTGRGRVIEQVSVVSSIPVSSRLSPPFLLQL
jgi:methionyl aminopeptidase